MGTLSDPCLLPYSLLPVCCIQQTLCEFRNIPRLVFSSGKFISLFFQVLSPVTGHLLERQLPELTLSINAFVIASHHTRPPAFYALPRHRTTMTLEKKCNLCVRSIIDTAGFDIGRVDQTSAETFSIMVADPSRNQQQPADAAKMKRRSGEQYGYLTTMNFTSPGSFRFPCWKTAEAP